MRFGIHLPQYGRASGPEAIRRATRQADELGFSDVWVYDHVAIPAGVSYPAAFSYEPLVTLSFAAGASERVGLGFSVLVVPLRHPLFLAKALASLDRLSKGRLVVGAGVGWLEGEFRALGVPFEDRGLRTDEAIDLLRACWEGDQPVTFEGQTVRVEQMKVLPQPGRRVPVWVGGHSPAALRRAVTKGDGWHGAFVGPDQVGDIARRLRAERPEPEFTLSVRMEWDGLSSDHDAIRRDLDAFAEAGIQHVMAAPAQSDLDAWLRSVEALGQLFGLGSP